MDLNELYTLPVSVFDTITHSGSTGNMTTMPLHEALSIGNKHTATIEIIRSYAGKETTDIERRYKELKGTLPAFTPSCLCGNGAKDVVTTHPILCLDIDAKDNMGMDIETAKDYLIALPSIFYVSKSVGGKGIFALMALSGSDDFKERMNAAKKYIYDSTGYIIDKSCSNSNRLRIISYDGDVQYKTGTIHPFPEKKAEDTSPLYKPTVTLPIITYRTSHGRMEEDLLNDDKFCTAVADYCINHLGIKTGDYADWLSHMGALSTLEMEGEALAQQLSVQSPGYKDADDVRKTLRSTKGKGNHRQYLLRYFKECKDALGHDWIKIIKAQYNCFNAA